MKPIALWRNVVVALVVLAGVTVGLYMTRQTNEFFDGDPDAGELPYAESPGTNDLKSLLGEESKKPENGDQSVLSHKLALREQQLSWNEAKGYTDWLRVRPDYIAYSTETLRTLADNGDREAQLLLGSRIQLSDPQLALKYFKDAAVRGYTLTLLYISNIYLMMAQNRTERAIGPKNNDAYYYSEAVAWILVGEARGDSGASFRLARLLEEVPESERSELLSLACQIAPVYYEELVTNRTDLGLGPFDNSPYPLLTQPFVPGNVCESWPLARPKCEEFELDGNRFFRCG